MFAGAAGAVAAGGAAAWANRDQITTGWTWASSHLEFVGSLARPEELKKRVRGMVRLSEELDVGFANLYTRLGKAAPSKTVSMVGTVLGPDRTFCNLPKKMDAGEWREAVNDKATDETQAHMSTLAPFSPLVGDLDSAADLATIQACLSLARIRHMRRWPTTRQG